MTYVAGETFEYPVVTETVNGVFKGGGAKGLVYAGALHELRARGIWFRSVAGASAGAITAVLVAAGYAPHEILGLAPDALLTVKPNRVAWLKGTERSLYRTGGLRDWIESRLRQQLSTSSDSPTTFRQLDEAGFGIELNVVAMDLARNEPIIFNSTVTPDFSIAEAAVASSAIPVAMTSRRVLVARSGHPHEIHRLVDGGTWANYPAFVYRDASVRSFFGLASLEQPNTLGFVIEREEYGRHLKLTHGAFDTIPPDGWQWPAPPPVIAASAVDHITSAPLRRTRFDLGSARRMGAVGALLTWAGLRWLILAFIAVGVAVLVSNWGQGVLAGNPLDLPGPYQRSGTVLLFVAVVVAFSLGLTLIALAIRMGAEAVDAGLPSLLAATSASLGVPRWVGHAADDRVVRLSAPLGISVVGFKADGQLRKLAVVVGADQCAAQLDALFPGSARSSVVPTVAEVTGLDGAEGLYIHNLRKRFTPKADPTTSGAMFVTLVWFTVLVAIFWIAPSAASIVFSLLVGVPFTWWVVVLLVRGRMYNQSMSASVPSPPNPWRRILPGLMWLALGYVGLANPQSMNEGDGWATGGLVLGQIYEFAAGISLVAGVICILSGLSRFSARIAARRYRRQVSGDAP